jgi:hypothetical protein
MQGEVLIAWEHCPSAQNIKPNEYLQKKVYTLSSG